MKVIEYIRLGECAICPYSDKKRDKKLRCHWSDKKSELCKEVKACGSFPDTSDIKVDIANIKL